MAGPDTGYLLQWDSTKAGTPADPKAIWVPPPWTASAQTILTPRGQHAGDITTETIEVDNECRALYLRRAEIAWTSALVGWRTTTALTGGTVGELAIAKGNPVVGAGASLTTLGSANATSKFVGSGNATLTIALTGVARGDHLWLLYWQLVNKGGTLARFRGYLADDILSGLALYASGTQPSTMSPATAFSVRPSANNGGGIWSAVQVS
jgi:hypothetical protein